MDVVTARTLNKLLWSDGVILRHVELNVKCVGKM